MATASSALLRTRWNHDAQPPPLCGSSTAFGCGCSAAVLSLAGGAGASFAAAAASEGVSFVSTGVVSVALSGCTSVESLIPFPIHKKLQTKPNFTKKDDTCPETRVLWEQVCKQHQVRLMEGMTIRKRDWEGTTLEGGHELFALEAAKKSKGFTLEGKTEDAMHTETVPFYQNRFSTPYHTHLHTT